MPSREETIFRCSFYLSRNHLKIAGSHNVRYLFYGIIYIPVLKTHQCGLRVLLLHKIYVNTSSDLLDSVDYSDLFDNADYGDLLDSVDYDYGDLLDNVVYCDLLDSVDYDEFLDNVDYGDLLDSGDYGDLLDNNVDHGDIFDNADNGHTHTELCV
ncbi:hypothetical protein SNE40_003484 [Patella caerulea]|uniref:Uncharacterized protein n=1 Tax=Patella caerulea TaxID=87958 RepID=A0AAN8KEC3_PATCE